MIAPLTEFFHWPADGPGSAWCMTPDRLAWWDAEARKILAARKPKSRGRP